MRHVATTGRSIVASVVLLVATGSAAVAAAHRDDSRSPSTHAEAAELVEAPECWTANTDTPSTYPGANVQTVTLAIEATALLAVDEHGRVTAAETNTGCAPRPGDHIYLRHPDGTLTDAPGYDVTGLRFTGDFTLFGYHPAAAG